MFIRFITFGVGSFKSILVYGSCFYHLKSVFYFENLYSLDLKTVLLLSYTFVSGEDIVEINLVFMLLKLLISINLFLCFEFSLSIYWSCLVTARSFKISICLVIIGCLAARQKVRSSNPDSGMDNCSESDSTLNRGPCLV